MTPLAPSSSSYPPGDYPGYAQAPGANTPSPPPAPIVIGGQAAGQGLVWNGVSWEPQTTTAGAWQLLTLVAAKVERGPGSPEPAVRLELGGTIARLRGQIKVKVGQELTLGAEPFALPAAAIPKGSLAAAFLACYEEGAFTTTIEVSAFGVQVRKAVAASHIMSLDGLTYPLT